MLGIITTKKIFELHYAFNIIGYYIDDNLSYDDFISCFYHTLNRTIELKDAKNIIFYASKCIKNWNKVKKIFSKEKYLKIWKDIPWEKNDDIKFCEEDETVGSFYITNALTKNPYKNIKVSTVVLDEQENMVNEVIEIVYSKERFRTGCYVYGDYYAQFNPWSSKKMKIYKDEILISEVILDRKYHLHLENNITPYEIISNESGKHAIYRKEYLDSLSNGEEADFEQSEAFIIWDSIKKLNYACVANLLINNFENDWDFFILLTATLLLIYKRKMNEVLSLSLIPIMLMFSSFIFRMNL